MSSFHSIAGQLGTSLHHQLSTVMKEAILSSKYVYGEAFPSEDELCRMFDVSRITVRRAMQSLESEGFIEKRRGRGTFVIYKPSKENENPLGSFSKGIGDMAARTTPSILNFEFVEAQESIRRDLKLEEGEKVLRVVRVRMRDGLPILHLTSMIPENIGKRFSREDFVSHSVASLLERAGHAHKRIELSAGATLADPLTAQLLSVAVGSPLLDIRRLALDASDKPVEYLFSLAPPDRYRLNMAVDTNAAHFSMGLTV